MSDIKKIAEDFKRAWFGPGLPDAFRPREPKVVAEPLLWNLHRLIDEYGWRGVDETLHSLRDGGTTTGTGA